MSLNARFNLKCALRMARLTYALLWLSEQLAMRDCMSVAFTVSDRNDANELYFLEYEVCTNFRRGLPQRCDEPELSR